MTHIVKHEPEPTPATFSIEGLSKDDLILLRDLVGKLVLPDNGPINDLYEKLWEAVKWEFPSGLEHFKFTANYSTDKVHSLTVIKIER